MLPAITLISSIIQLAPALAKVFGAGAEKQELAEVVAEVAQRVTGTSSNDDALAILQKDPQKLIELQTAILQQETDLEGLYVQDKQNARARDSLFLEAGVRNLRADFLVGISVVVVFSILGIVTIESNLNEYAKGALTTILGVFLNQLTNVFNFEFGTTRKGQAGE